jgi:NADH-quinone oxidoreductase subunit M
MLSLLGAYRPGPGLPRPAFVTFMAIGGLGVVLTMAGFLRLQGRLTFRSVPRPVPMPAPVPAPGSAVGAGSGEADRPDDAGGREVRLSDYAIFVPLIALILSLGLWPKTLLELTDGPVRALLGGG